MGVTVAITDAIDVITNMRVSGDSSGYPPVRLPLQFATFVSEGPRSIASMNRLTWIAVLGGVSSAALLGSAGVAQADEQAFLDQIPPRNYISMWTTDAGRLAQGYQICTMIKTGTPPHVVAESYRWDDGWAWVNAAQRELCPDTLGTSDGQPQP